MPSEMIIEFQKKRDKAILRCKRPDGSFTFSRMQHAMAFHDLAHFAVETELGFTKAFYGLLALGYEIEDFELPRDQRPQALLPSNLPQESLQTEHLVNLLQVYALQPNDTDIPEQLAQILSEKNLNYPFALTPEHLSMIQVKLKKLWGRWKALEIGGSLFLRFRY